MDFLPPITREQEGKLIDSGTKSALDKLALHNLQEAVRYAHHCAHGKLEETELISLCWIALRQAAENYCHKKSNGIRFFAFCKQYLRGQISAEYRKTSAMRHSEQVAEVEAPEDALVPVSIEPDFSNIETKELLAGLRPVIFSELNERERAILILRYDSGFSFGEIGERIGFSRQSIQKTHAAALLKLRGALQEKRTQLI